MKIIIFLTLLTIISSCSREYNCEDTSITPVFIKFQPADIDTLVIRKYAINSNFTNQLDSGIIEFGRSGNYISQNDTTIIQSYSEKLSVKNGFEWQIYIPAKNKSINITDIKSENRIEKCSTGFSSKLNCACTNQIFSCKKDNVQVNFSASTNYNLYITN